MKYFKYLITAGRTSLLGMVVGIIIGVLPISIEKGPIDTGMVFFLSLVSLVLIILFVRSLMMYSNYKLYNRKIENLFNAEKYLHNKNGIDK